MPADFMKMHQKDQNIVRPGCDLKFTRAGALMLHLEDGGCRNAKEPERQITKEDFNDHLTRKTLLHHILQDPSEYLLFHPHIDVY